MIKDPSKPSCVQMVIQLITKMEYSVSCSIGNISCQYQQNCSLTFQVHLQTHKLMNTTTLPETVPLDGSNDSPFSQVLPSFNTIFS